MKLLRFACLASVIALASPALAQEAKDNNATEARDGDIVVTATRTESRLSKTPIAMTAVTGDTLRSTGITNPTALADSVPNLDISRNNGLQITIRGVTSTDGTEKGDPSAAFMLDGIYIARSQVQEVSFYDIGRVEVLRGPQGTLYGRNTTAGLVNVISAKPEFGHFGASGDISYGNYNALQATGMINAPVGDKVAIRLAANYDVRDSYLRPGPTFTADLGQYKKNFSIRAAIRAQIGNGELTIRADRSHLGGTTFNTPFAGTFYSGLAGTFVNPVYIGSQASTATQLTVNTANALPMGRNNKTWGVMADFSQDLGPVMVNYLGSYREFDRHEDGLSLQGGGTRTIPTRFDGHYWQQSHELRFSTTGTGPLKAQAGGYYFQEQSGIYFYLFGLLGAPGTRGYVFGFPQNPTKAASYAGFAQATYSFTPALRLTGGVRYSHDHKSRVGATVQCVTTACNITTGATPDILGLNNADRTFSKTTWRVGLDYDVNDRTLAYATVSTGYKAGGFNDGCVIGSAAGCARTPDSLYYNPETLKAYEIGLKTRFAGDAMRLNLSAFHYDYSNLQLSQVMPCSTGSSTLCQFTANAGKAKIDGVEVESIIQPGPNDKFDLNVNWLNARYSQYDPGLVVAGSAKTVSWAGLALDRSPKWTVAAGYTHTQPLANGGNIQAGIHTRMSASYKLAAIGNVYQFTQPSFTKTDATLTYNAAEGRYYLQAFVKNIENNIVVTTATPGANGAAQLGDPRTYGVRAGFKF